MNKSSKIYVAGHKGLVGSAIVRNLTKSGYFNLVLRSKDEVDLTDAKETRKFFETEKPEYVFIAAAKVGGILANDTYPADFIRENLAIQNNIFESAHRYKVKKLLFLGSSCIYPADCPQPIKEEYFLTGPLEQTNIAYAIAKIAGVIECQSYHRQYGCNFISVMPTNLYGPNDNFNPETSHAFPAILSKIHNAKASGAPELKLWGTGKPKREFLFVDDLADALLFLMNNYDGPEIINIGTGEDISIADFVELVKKIIGFDGQVKWDKSKPDGTIRKQLDVSKLHALGWKHKTELQEGIKIVYDWFLNNVANKT